MGDLSIEIVFAVRASLTDEEFNALGAAGALKLSKRATVAVLRELSSIWTAPRVSVFELDAIADDIEGESK